MGNKYLWTICKAQFTKVFVLLLFLGFSFIEITSASEVRENELTGTQRNYHLLIDKSDYKLYLFQGEDLVKEYSIAIGKNSGDKKRVGDLRTPIGFFRVDGIFDSQRWTHDFKDGKGEIPGAYGPWFISLATPWEGIGIHGTHDPDSIGTSVSEGCIRMRNSDVAELKEYLFINILVEVRE